MSKFTFVCSPYSLNCHRGAKLMFHRRSSYKSASNFARGPRRGTVPHIRPIGPCRQWHTPNLPLKVPLPVDRSPNPMACLIPGPARPTMPNGIQIRSAIFPQCTGQINRWTDQPTDSSRESLTTIGGYAPRAAWPNNNNNNIHISVPA